MLQCGGACRVIVRILSADAGLPAVPSARGPGHRRTRPGDHQRHPGGRRKVPVSGVTKQRTDVHTGRRLSHRHTWVESSWPKRKDWGKGERLTDVCWMSKTVGAWNLVSSHRHKYRRLLRLWGGCYKVAVINPRPSGVFLWRAPLGGGLLRHNFYNLCNIDAREGIENLAIVRQTVWEIWRKNERESMNSPPPPPPVRRGLRLRGCWRIKVLWRVTTSRHKLKDHMVSRKKTIQSLTHT